MDPKRITDNMTDSRNQTIINTSYDYEGAMKFMVVTIMVYSLLGILSMLLLRIRRRARQAANKSPEYSESSIQKFLKDRKTMEMENLRYQLRCEQKKCLGGYVYLDRGLKIKHPRQCPGIAVSVSRELVHPLLQRSLSDRRSRKHIYPGNSEVIEMTENPRTYNVEQLVESENGSESSKLDTTSEAKDNQKFEIL